jgi:hypothetical protein
MFLKVVGLGFLGSLGVLAFLSLPELKRYLKIRSM